MTADSSTLQQQALAFLESTKDLERRQWVEAYEALEPQLRRAVADEHYAQGRAVVERYFTPENEHPEEPEIRHSPSDRYQLQIRRFSTREGCWSYSQGEVLEGERLIATVNRNYGMFPASWLEDHANGHSYLICGEDYQGQTIIELDTGRRRDHIPEEATLGFGFCWAAHRYDPRHQMLIVDGCYWSAPYEYRFYDLSDPMSGWPEIEHDAMILVDDHWPEVQEDGTIRICQYPVADDDTDTDTDADVDADTDADANADADPATDTDADADANADADPATDSRIPSVISTLRREGMRLVLQDEWISDEELERRAKAKEAAAQYEQWWKDFKATNPLYLAAKQLMGEPPFNPEEHLGVGITYEGWCPDFTGQERRICHRILRQLAGKHFDTVDLEWAHATGPIKLIIYRYGEQQPVTFYDHSVAGMEEAFANARATFRSSEP